MKIFNLPNDYMVICNSKNTRSGFKHEATLCHNGREIHSTEIRYLNRTWERFTFESVLLKVISQGIDLHPEVYIAFVKSLDDYGDIKKEAAL